MSTDGSMIGWSWVNLPNVQVGDILSHWGGEDIVRSIEKQSYEYVVVVYDGLLKKDVTHTFKETDALLVKNKQ